MPLRIDRIIGDRPFAEIEQPALAVADEHRGLLGVAGTPTWRRPFPVGVYSTGDLVCRALLRARHPVRAMAFHPVLPLLAVGTGRYDGGYFFEGELLLLSWESGRVVSLIDEGLGRMVLGLEWLDEHALRVLTAPLDDWEDEAAHEEGHVAVVRRPDWSTVDASSLWAELEGPRVPAPRSDGTAAARAVLTQASSLWEPRRTVRAVERLHDGRILAALDGVALESWRASGEREWSAPGTEGGGREIVVEEDRETAWVSLVSSDWEGSKAVAGFSLTDGSLLDQVVPSVPVSLVRCANGRPALAPSGGHRPRSALPIRNGSRVYFRTFDHPARMSAVPPAGGEEPWIEAAPMPEPGARRPAEPAATAVRRLFPHSWTPGEIHFGGPGVETREGDLVHTGTVHHGHGLQPGGSFVVRRSAQTGTPLWAFRTDRPATAMDADADRVYIGYDDGEIVVLDLRDGSVRHRAPLTVGAVIAVPTALTVTAPAQLLVGTSDGRILDCSLH
ncbi:outer membrane protein assembly factor BamB family protein [Actinocorallia populi]|uniref:outer membrane protein assembly factor BamB family protein n=1 Tax=Actinocorallia populi TaxID=2079200 RepID=UPI000D09426D|nr:PQQ-binding-like beta-propeller repeat protein [Actinocorallia populi]